MRAKRPLARTLAATLANGPWERTALVRRLQSRLPRALHSTIPKLISELQSASSAPYAPPIARLTDILLSADPFTAIHSYCLKHSVTPSPDLSKPVMTPLPVFRNLAIPQLTTTAALADWLLLDPKRLDYLSDPASRHETHGDMAVNHYHTHLHPKPRGGHRLIEAPKQALKTCQRAILTQILNQIPAHPDAFGFIKHRNCAQAASRHAGEAMVICFDIQNFFPSIQATRIFALMRRLGYPEAVARALTALCTTKTPARVLSRLEPSERSTYSKPHLPQGAPSSPALANLTLFALDRRLSGLARSLGANYSRYADDLTFSGDRSITAPLLRLVPEILSTESLVLNPTKTRIMPSGSSQQVTGIQVNQHLNLPRKDFDRLKAVIHASGKDGRLLDPAYRASLEGKITWAASLNPHRGAKLQSLLARAGAAS